MSSLPATLPFDQIKAALASLSIPTERLASALIEPRSITVTHHLVDENGKKVLAGDAVATVVTKIGIQYGSDGT